MKYRVNKRICQWDGEQSAPRCQRFPAQSGEVSRVLAFVETAAKACGLDAARWASLAMAVDEAFTNIVSYAYSSDDAGVIVVEIVTDATLAPPMIGVRLHDSGTPFNPLEAASDIDSSVPLMERRLGGIGIAMIRKLVDRVDYDDAAGNTLTLWMQKTSGE